jgi:hypothetical protein
MPIEPNGNAKSPSANPKDLSEQQVARFVSKVKNFDQQIGEHVLAALQHPNTVAVLTTVVVGPTGEQHIVSASLNSQKMSQVNQLLEDAQEVMVEDEVCYGFHCLINPK